MIVNLAGSGGSGKTFVAKQLIYNTKAEAIFSAVRGRSKRPLGYIGWLGNTRRIGIVGPYTATCGGLDAVGTIDNQLQMICAFADNPGIDVVFYEGLMVGKSVGTIGAYVKEFYNKRHVKAFLDTPLDVCIARVQERREFRGTPPLLDTHNLKNDYRALQASRRNSAAFGLTCVDVNYEHAYNAVVALLKGASNAKA